MGCIYTGFDDQLGRQVAIKISTVSQDGVDPRLSREAEVLAHLAHPNIVPVYNKGCDDAGRPFYAMKLVKGRSLQDILNLIRAGDPAAVAEYPTPALLTMFRKVCDAMAFAHSQQILHRDLKPDNVMVGEYGEVLVMDWGLAKRIGEDPEETGSGVSSQPTQQDDFGMTMEGEVVGTPQYMSPEQAEGMIAELDQRSDVYALGAVLYAIFTLRPPVDGTSLNEVLTNVRLGKISAIKKSKGAGKCRRPFKPWF
jgi:serine/threonine protein kinase